MLSYFESTFNLYYISLACTVIVLSALNSIEHNISFILEAAGLEMMFLQIHVLFILHYYKRYDYNSTRQQSSFMPQILSIILEFYNFFLTKRPLNLTWINLQYHI